MFEYRLLFSCIALIVGVKISLLRFPYFSTDFLVHRNWLAITKHRPPSEWYYDTTDSYNTLDYPPNFAHFECFLSRVLGPVVSPAFVDPTCFDLLSTEDGASPSPSCVVFQRLTVNLVDFLLFVPSAIYAAHSVNEVSTMKAFSSTAVAALLISNAGLLILDHMHFQYNAGLFSLLLFSLTVESTLVSAVLYVLLITSKHLYLILGPLYVVKMFSGYCLPGRYFSLRRFFVLAVTTLSGETR